jgi:cobalt-zinc-cadmium efflux system outer membrane protein
MGSWTDLRWRPLAIVVAFSVGCTAPPLASPAPLATGPQNASPSPLPTARHPEIQTTSFAQSPTAVDGLDRLPVASDALPTPSVVPAQQACESALTSLNELSAEAVVAAVLARNPSLAQMTAAWEVASARYPQVTSLDDPMVGATGAPGSIGSNNVNFAFRVEISQKYPWRGKLALRGANAQAETSAAAHDVEDMRLQLVESARNAFYEYYLVDRALAVNDEALRLLKEFRDNASTRYKTGLVPEQDVLQADVEIGRQQARQVTLDRMREVAVARINTLMHLPTHSPLPPPPKQVQLAAGLPEVQALQAVAVAARPDLQALADRIAAEQALLALAQKEFCPDVEAMAAYDTFWQPPQQALQGQAGVRLNLPVRKARRFAAIAEARARIAQRQAELDRQRDQVNLQVEEAHAQVRESEQVVGLYTEKILPAAEANVKAARSAYVTGKIPFLSLIEAERNVVGLRDRYYETLADYFRRRAALERAVGGPLDSNTGTR